MQFFKRILRNLPRDEPESSAKLTRLCCLLSLGSYVFPFLDLPGLDGLSSLLGLVASDLRELYF